MPSTSVTLESIKNVVKDEVEKIEKIVGRPLKISADIRSLPGNSDFHITFRLLTEGDTVVASFKLYQFAGNCGMIVATGASVYSSYQRKGIGTILQTIKELLAKDAGYSQMMATTNHANSNAVKILQKYGWQDVPMLAFRNRRSGNPITVWMKRIA